VCCGLGQDAGAFCLDQVDIGGGVKLPDGGTLKLLDGGTVKDNCPTLCNPAFGPGCSGGETCCPEIKWNICAGVCLATSRCPAEMVPEGGPPLRLRPPLREGDTDAAWTLWDDEYTDWLAAWPNDAGCHPWVDAWIPDARYPDPKHPGQ
jgi:hypothetical protein